MSSRRLNPDRVRRHMARSTPDKTQILIDSIQDGAQRTYDVWLAKFMVVMKVKHGPDVRVIVFRDPMLGRWPGEVMYIAEAHKRCM